MGYEWFVYDPASGNVLGESLQLHIAQAMADRLNELNPGGVPVEVLSFTGGDIAVPRPTAERSSPA